MSFNSSEEREGAPRYLSIYGVEIDNVVIEGFIPFQQLHRLRGTVPPAEKHIRDYIYIKSFFSLT